MNHLYHDLLKDPKDLQKEETERLAQRTSSETDKLERANWLQYPPTRKTIKNIEVQFVKLGFELLNLSENHGIDSMVLRAKLVEQQTIRKVLNLINYGTYSERAG